MHTMERKFNAANRSRFQHIFHGVLLYQGKVVILLLSR